MTRHTKRKKGSTEGYKIMGKRLASSDARKHKLSMKRHWKTSIYGGVFLRTAPWLSKKQVYNNRDGVFDTNPEHRKEKRGAWLDLSFQRGEDTERLEMKSGPRDPWYDNRYVGQSGRGGAKGWD